MTEYSAYRIKNSLAKENFFLIVATLLFGLIWVIYKTASLLSTFVSVVVSLVLATIIMIFYYA